MYDEFAIKEPKVWLCRKPEYIDEDDKEFNEEEELLMFFTEPFKDDDGDGVITYGPYSEDYYINLDVNMFKFVTVENSPFEIDLIELIKMKYE